ncbi:MAG: biotin carboxylase N-terminal domain-containing protein, partial [Pseudomonadota bacterium]
MIKKILIANRGEIACRIIRTARKMNIRTVAVYSDADVNAPHKLSADEAFYIGPAPSAQSYLNIERIEDAIKRSGADSVHPGYGFLSESSLFCERLRRQNITFIGPPPNAIRSMGDKIESKQIAAKAGVNMVPGDLTVVKNHSEAAKIANQIGYPVRLKAAAGGGG